VPKALSNPALVSWLLRLGLVAVFLYAALSSLQHPQAWVGFLPAFLTKAVAGPTILKVLAIYELVLSAWLLSGRWLQYCALVCAVTLAGIVISTPAQLIITFRDAGLACMALALFFAEK